MESLPRMTGAPPASTVPPVAPSLNRPHRRYRPRTCETCTRPFTPRSGTHRHCPDHERSKLKAELIDKWCDQCGALVRTYSPHQKYCSKQCRSLAQTVGKKCRGQCGTDLTGIKFKHYCDPCRDERRVKHNRSKNYSGSDYRRRARHFDVTYQPVDPTKVYHRDNWRCGICAKKINHKLQYPHSMSVSLDHITPLSQGGNHTYDNCQAAHLACNVKKGIGGTDQLRLFG